MAEYPFLNRNTSPIDLSEMGGIKTNMPLPTIGNPPPSSWLPKTPQGRVVNPKVGYIAPALNTGGGFKGLNLNTGAAMGPIPGAIGALATLLQNRGDETTTPPTTQKIVTPTATPPVSNSVTPLASPLDPHGFATVGGKRINYGDIGDNRVTALPTAQETPGIGGGTNLGDILKTIQTVKPVEDYANRVGALNTGNTTWDMNSLDKILAAKAGQQADTERYKEQVGALANLGSAQMQAEAAKAGHQMQFQGEQMKNAYMSPYYSALGKEAGAKAEAAPLTAKADILKALTEQSKENPVLKASLEALKGFADRGDSRGYNDYAAKISMLTGKLIPKMLVQD
jgi:hypothetical protein